MKLKRAIIFVLCAILSFSLVACSKAPAVGGVDTSVQYTVTFSVGTQAAAAGVVVVPSEVKVYKGSTLAQLEDGMPEPTRYKGYSFDGWYTMPNGGGTKITDTTPIMSNMSLTAKWVSDEERNAASAEYEKTLTAENGWTAGHLYIHYKRYSHDADEQGKENTGAPNYNNAIGSSVYDDWALWCWPKNDEGRLFYPWRIDYSGEVFDVLLDHDYTDAGWDETTRNNKGLTINYAVNKGKEVTTVGMQLFSVESRKGQDFWANDGGDNDLNLKKIKRADGTYHWFVTQGHVINGSAGFVAAETPDPYKGLAAGSQTTRTTVGNGIIDSNKESGYAKVTQRVSGWDEDSVGYQIFIASFADSDGDGMGDLRGIIERLDYLKSLNVDVLWLTPFQSSTGYHGYDIKDYYSVDARFGTLADYRELVYKVHQNGMKIVMDFVLNHTSRSNPWFVKSQNLVKETAADGSEIDYRQFYTWINKTQHASLPAKQRDGVGEKHNGRQWFGPLNGNGTEEDGYYFYSSFSSDMPELNYDYQPVRDAVLDVCNYWMSFGLDGFRLDAVKHIYMQNEVESVGKTLSKDIQIDEDNSYNHDRFRNLNFYREFNARLKAAYPNAFVVGENLDGNPERTASYYQGIDSQFNFNMYYDASRAIAQLSGIKFNNETTEPGWIGGLGTGYASGHQKYAAANANYIDGQFTSNHDLPRARDRMNIIKTISGDSKIDDTYGAFYTDGTMDGSKGGSLDTAAIEKTDALLRLYYAFQFTIPGITWIYYGDELGMTGIMQFTLDHPTGSTSSTASSAHEDRIYRQPMKWYTTETADKKNGGYSIGFNNLTLELTGYNKDGLAGVDNQLTDPNSLLNWVKKLTGIRDSKGLGKASVQGAMQNNNGILTYTVQGSKGKIKVEIGVGVSSDNSALASYSKTIGGRTYGVRITAA